MNRNKKVVARMTVTSAVLVMTTITALGGSTEDSKKNVTGNVASGMDGTAGVVVELQDTKEVPLSNVGMESTGIKQKDTDSTGIAVGAAEMAGYVAQEALRGAVEAGQEYIVAGDLTLSVENQEALGDSAEGMAPAAAVSDSAEEVKQASDKDVIAQAEAAAETREAAEAKAGAAGSGLEAAAKVLASAQGTQDTAEAITQAAGQTSADDAQQAEAQPETQVTAAGVQEAAVQPGTQASADDAQEAASQQGAQISAEGAQASTNDAQEAASQLGTQASADDAQEAASQQQAQASADTAQDAAASQASAQGGQNAAEQDAQPTTAPEAQTPADAKEDSAWAGKVMANVEEDMNIRTSPDAESELAGKFYRGDVAEVISVEGEWTKISSGNATGYVKNEYLVYGEEAGELANEVCSLYATVNTDGLRLRSEPHEEAGIVTTASDGDRLKVNKEVEGTDGWVAVYTSDSTAYVSAEYVNVALNLGTALNSEEVAAKEAEEKRAAQGSSKKASVSANSDEVTLLGALIQCEAGGGSYDGMVAVGAVVMNRVRSGSYPGSISGVIYQGGQFTPALNGGVARVMANGVSGSCLQAARDAINGTDNTNGALSFRSASSGHAGRLIGANVFF